MKLKLLLIVLLALGAYFFYASAALVMRLSANVKAAQQIRVDLIEQYLDVECEASAGYDSGVHLKIFGVTEPAKQVGIKDWLVRWKADHELNVPIWLQFHGNESIRHSGSFDFGLPDTFKL